MTKTAIIITGQARTFQYTFKTLHWTLLRKLNNPHFFVSVSDDPEGPTMDLLRQKYDHVETEFVKQPEKIDEPDGGLDRHAGWFRSASVQNILKQFWALERGYKFFLEKAGNNWQEFDTVVRVRPDLWCQDITLPEHVGPNECFTPWWSTWGGVNDRMAIMGTDAAAPYFSTFSERFALWNLGCPLHPETMLKGALELAGVRIIPKLRAEFRICRLPDKDHKVPWVIPEGLCQHELINQILDK